LGPFCSLEVCSTGTLIVEVLFIPICQDGIDGRPVATPGKGDEIDETDGIIVLIVGVVGDDKASAIGDLRLRIRDFNDLSS